MAKFFTVDADASALLAALDQLGAVAERHVKNAAAVTAGRIQQEARARVRRATGQTAAAITVDEAPAPLGGYRVYVGQMGQRPTELPLWLEFGTVKMTAQPFLLSSARLEAGAHERRIAEAIQDAIDEVGLG